MIRRKNYFIKKKFQTNFSSRFAILILLEAVLIAGLFIYIANNTLTTGYSNSVLRIEKTLEFFLVPFVLIIPILGIGIGLAGMVIFIFLSHRIAGPLYRFEQDIKNITEGDLTKRINLRKTDQLTVVKESLNSLVESLDNGLGKIKGRLAEIERLISDTNNQENIAKAVKKIELLKKETGHFRVTREISD